MKKQKYVLIFFSLLFLIFNSACVLDIPDYAHNVRYVRKEANSSYAVLCWDSLDGADEYLIYRKNLKRDDSIEELERVTKCTYGLDDNNTLYANEDYAYAVEASVSGNKTYCSKFVTLEKDITYEDIK